jgi:steroid 5-alpha reductase family enzyme
MDYYPFMYLVVLGYMLCLFFISLKVKRNDIADVGWGIGFVVMAWVSYFVAGGMSIRGAIVCMLVTIWGIRLAWHIHSRNKGRPEDYRYLAWRNAWGRWFYLRSFFQIYILQGTLLYIVIQPVLLINRSVDTPLGLVDLIGIVLWIVGFCFEVIGDRQLSLFIKDINNKGKLMMTGLWAYTRHPNYFGEVTVWWGIWIIALSSHGGFWSIIGPLTITYLILKVSGIPMLEKKMSEHPDFEKYKSTTSVFIPLPKESNTR